MHKYVCIRPLFISICMYVCIYMDNVMNIYVLLQALSSCKIFSNAGQEEPELVRVEASKYIPAETVPSKLTSNTWC